MRTVVNTLLGHTAIAVQDDRQKGEGGGAIPANYMHELATHHRGRLLLLFDYVG